MSSIRKGVEAQASVRQQGLRPTKHQQEGGLEPAIDLDGLESYESIYPIWRHTRSLLSNAGEAQQRS